MISGLGSPLYFIFSETDICHFLERTPVIPFHSTLTQVLQIHN